MAVAIRMKMIGRKHQPFFRVVVIDRQKAREGRNIEEVGTYDPLLKDKSKRAILNLERIDYWISVGAQPSDRVATLIKKMKTNKIVRTRGATSRCATALIELPSLRTASMIAL